MWKLNFLVACMAFQPTFGAFSVWALPGGQVRFCFCLRDDGGLPIANQPVNWSASAAPFSGWHAHNVPIRHPGSISPAAGSTTGPDGCAQGVYYATDVAGEYRVEASAFPSGGYVFDYFIVYVRVFAPELMELPNYHVYRKVGSKWAHPLSHWGTFATVYRIQQICEEFFNRTGIAAGINDISLPWGGRFDLGPDEEYRGVWWGPPHHEHMWGRNVDVSYSYLRDSSQTEIFAEIARRYAAVLTEKNCYHLTFPE